MASKTCVIIVLVLCLGIAFATTQPNSYYEKIGVSHDATIKAIRKAYFQLASTVHPEKNTQDTKEVAQQKFVELANAYEVLSDITKRERYNSLLEYGQTEYTDASEGFKFKDAYEVFNTVSTQEAASDPTMTLVITGVIMVVGAAVIYTMYGNQSQKKKDDKKKQMLDKVKTRQHKDDAKPTKVEQPQKRQQVKQETSKPTKAEQPVEQQPSAFEEEENIDELLEDQENDFESQEVVEGEDSEKKQPKAKARDRSTKKNDAPSSEFYCAACRKAFKSTSQWENHERSKKHKDELKRLNL